MSLLALARSLPSGLKATELTMPVWPVRDRERCKGLDRADSRLAAAAAVIRSTEGLEAEEQALVWQGTARRLYGLGT